MKQKSILLAIWFMVFAVSGIVMISSCDKNDDDEFSAIIETYTIEPSYVYSSVLLPTEHAWTFSLYNSWTSPSGHNFDVFILQDGVFHKVGNIHSNEKSITDAYAELHIDVKIPIGIDKSRTYQMVAIDGSCGAKLSDGRITLSFDLERGNTNVPGWYLAKGGNYMKAQSFFTSASEFLHIKNNTNKTIKVKQKGYDTNQKWYYDKGNMSITTDLKIIGNGSFGEESSSTLEIPAGEEDVILSRYVASGKKMTNACAVLEIDGKEVKTSPASSSINIENGENYILFVKWDGTKLEWWNK